MNILIFILLMLALLGAGDKIIHNKFQLGEEFDRGMNVTVSLLLSMVGIYCFSITISRNIAQEIKLLSNYLPFDPVMLVASILAPDLGGYSVSTELATNPYLGILAGVVLSSLLGGTISFALPIALNNIEKEDMTIFMEGIVFGVITSPFGMFVGGVILKIPLQSLLVNMLPSSLLCGIICITLLKVSTVTIKVFLWVGEFFKILSIVSFAAIAISLFFPQLQWVERELIHDSLVIVVKIVIVICGSFVLAKMILSSFGAQITKLSQKFKINEYAVIGLLLSLITSVSMFAIFNKMDLKGKYVNAAFCVSGAFVFGGQFAFISNVEKGTAIIAYFAAKFVGGIFAVLAVKLVKAKTISSVELF